MFGRGYRQGQKPAALAEAKDTSFDDQAMHGGGRGPIARNTA